MISLKFRVFPACLSKMINFVAWLLIINSMVVVASPLSAIAQPNIAHLNIVQPVSLQPVIAQPSAPHSTPQFLQSETQMPPSDLQTIIQTAIQAWTEGQPEAFVELFADDGEFIVPGDRWVGKEAIRQVTQEFLANHTVTIDVQHVVIQGQSAAVEWTWHERNAATGNRQKADDVIWIELVNGKIQRWREYIDDKTP